MNYSEPIASPSTPAQPTGLASIRTRLILALMLLVLAPITIISTVLLFSDAQGGRQERIRQLDTVLQYKENALLDWAALLQTEMNSLLQSPDLVAQITNILTPGYTGVSRYESLRGIERYFSTLLLRSRLIDELIVVEPGGIIIYSSHLGTGESLAGETYFQRSLVGPTNSPPSYDPDLGETSILFLRPIFSQSGDTLAVVGARANMNRFESIMLDKRGLGQSGETFLAAENRIMMSGVSADQIGQFNRTTGVEQALSGRGGGDSLYENYRGEPVIGVYRYIPELQSALVAEQTQAELSRSIAAAMAVNNSVAITAGIIALFAALAFTRNLAEPLSDLTATATRFAGGDLEARADIQRGDELGVLAHAFNAMTGQLRDLIANLEQRVAERTAELERRTLFLEASTEVSRAAAAQLEPQQLIHEVVERIRERFQLYYVGLFLLDDERRWAVLRAGTGTAGQLMLNRGHRLQVGGASMIGWAVARGQARVALRAGEDPVRLATAELPKTRAEAALPLRSRGQVIGALTVQSETAGFFDDETIAVLQTMADQVAIALDNANLLAASRTALDAERRAYGELSRQAWRQWIEQSQALTYRSDVQGVAQVPQPSWSLEVEQAFRGGRTVMPRPSTGAAEETASADTTGAAETAGATETASAAETAASQSIAIPIRVRGQTIGVLNTVKPAGRGGWAAAEVEMLESITEQLAIALDSARLYSESQQRAEQERLVSQATANMRATLDVENVLQTAANEIYSVLQLDGLTIWLAPDGNTQTGNGNRPAPNGSAHTRRLEE